MTSTVTAHPLLAIWISGLLFAVLHSALASRRCKAWCHSAGLSLRAQRLAYVLIAVLTTALWLGFVRGLPDTPLYSIDGMGRWVLHAVQLLGAAILWRSIRAIDVGAFLGLRPFPDAREPFTERGIYRHLRHPMYTGVILILFAMPEQSLNRLNLYTGIALYFLIGSRLEERRMMLDHPEYADYRRRVPAFVPRIAGRR